MKIVKIDANLIHDWQSFHDVFSSKFGFIKDYGRNGMAWIDSMHDLDDPSAGMTQIHVDVGDFLVIQLDNVNSLAENNPDILRSLNNMVAFVNWRRSDIGQLPILALSYYYK